MGFLSFNLRKKKLSLSHAFFLYANFVFLLIFESYHANTQWNQPSRLNRYDLKGVILYQEKSYCLLKGNCGELCSNYFEKMMERLIIWSFSVPEQCFGIVLYFWYLACYIWHNKYIIVSFIQDILYQTSWWNHIFKKWSKCMYICKFSSDKIAAMQ